MKKKICMLLVTIFIIVTMVFVAPVYAAEKPENSKTSIVVTPYREKTEMEIMPYFYILRPSEKNLLLAKDENVVVLRINLNEQVTLSNIKYVSAKEGLTAKSFPNVNEIYEDEKIPYGTALQLIAEDNGWALVKKDNKLFFCWSSFLTDEKPELESKKEKEEVKVSKPKKEEKPVKKTETEEKVSNNSQTYSPKEFKRLGVIKWGGWRWTWYSQRVLPGGGLKIPGRHVDANGYVCDENGYICLASSSLEKGTIVDTPFGKQGKVYDCGCPTDTLDVYTDF